MLRKALHIIKNQDNFNKLLFFAIPFLYFNFVYHYWFVKLLGNYVIRIWFIPALLLYFVFLYITVRRRPLKLRVDISYSIFVATFVYGISCLIALAANENLYNVVRALLHFLGPIVIFLIIISWVRDNKFIETILTLVFIIAVLLSLHVLYIFKFDKVEAYLVPLETNTDVIALDLAQDDLLNETFQGRYTFPGIGPKAFAGMLVPIILYGFFLVKNKKGFYKIASAASTIVLIYILFMTVTRGALFTLITGLGSLAICKFFRLRQIVAVLGIVVIISVLNHHTMIIRTLSTFVFMEFFQELSFMQHVDKEIAIGKLLHRTDEIRNTLSLFFNSPLFGSGPTLHSFVATENYYFRSLAMLGIIGFVPFIILLYLIFNTVRTNLRKIKQSRSINIDLGIILFSGLICLMFDFLFQATTYYFPWLWFALAVAWVKNASIECINNKRELSNEVSSMG